VTYKEFLARTSFDRRELIALGHGTLVSDAPEDFVRLPLPPFLLLTRVAELHRGEGRIVAEQDVEFDHPIFQLHMLTDPIQPGCLTLDSIWGAAVVFLAVCGATGPARALGCEELEFASEIRPHHKNVRYELSIRRVSKLGNGTVALASGQVTVDGELACRFGGAKVGLFPGRRVRAYPFSGGGA